MRVLCTICMRGGSKGIKNKNLLKINNKYLIEYSINSAKKSNLFDEIVFSTDSKKIYKVGNSLGAKSWFLRSKKLSSSKSAKIPVIRDLFIKSEKYFNKNFDYIIDLDVTSPLRTSNDIKNAFNLFIKKKANNLISVTKAKKNPYFNMIEFNNNLLTISKKLNKKIIRRQDAPLVFEANASIYIWNRKTLLNNDILITNKTIHYEMPYERSIDIDSEIDYKIVKALIEKK